ncbi:MAG: TetR/AcrR family transcriptional regulator [Chloroflexota bacterium]
MSDTKTQIIQIAEQLVRSGGYNGFSFREIAAEIGIRSASVHYHFPSKEDLALAVANRYKQNFFEALGDPAPDGGNTKSQLAHYGQVFQDSFKASRSACLCGMLSNEIALLPAVVKQVLVSFIDENLKWLQQAITYGASDADSAKVKQQAQLVYAALEGAMSVSALMQSDEWLQSVSNLVAEIVTPD